MKNIIFLFGLLIFLGCKDSDPGIDPVQARLELLAKTWVPGSGTAVSVNSIDVSSEFASFTLTFTDSFGYSTANVGPNFTDVWPPTGTWVFETNADGSSNVNVIVRDGIIITISSINASSLNITFDYLNARAAGTLGIDGSYVFNMTPQ